MTSGWLCRLGITHYTSTSVHLTALAMLHASCLRTVRVTALGKVASFTHRDWTVAARQIRCDSFSGGQPNRVKEERGKNIRFVPLSSDSSPPPPPSPFPSMSSIELAKRRGDGECWREADRREWSRKGKWECGGFLHCFLSYLSRSLADRCVGGTMM